MKKNKYGWEIKKLGEVCETTSGGTPNRSKREYFEGKIPWVKSGELDKGLIIDTEEKITEEALKHSSAKLLPKGTLLIALYGATIGKLAFLGIEACTNQAICSIFKNDKIDSEFLYYFLHYKKPSLINKGVGVGQPNISQTILKNLSLPIPALSTQHQIVSELDALSEIINKKKQQLEELDKLAQATFYDMFGDPVSNERGWESDNLGNLCEIVRGGSPRPIEKFLGGDVPWIKIGDATKGSDIYLDATKEHIIREGVKKSRLIPKGSMIFANCGVSLGFARIITFEGCIHDGWLAFHNISNKLNEVFLLKHLNFQTDYFRKLAPEGTQPNLNTGIMNKTKVILPPIQYQQLFEKRIESIVSQKSLINQSVVDVQQLFDYTMDKYFN